MGSIYFNDQLKMEEILVGRWQENDKVYFISDDIFDEMITVDKSTGKVTICNGFHGLIKDYLDRGIFIVKKG